MALPALADIEALDARIVGGISTGDTARAEALLEDASVLVRKAAGATWVDAAGELVDDIPDEAVMVTLAAAKRAFENPKGVTSENAGPFGAQYARTTPDVLFLTKAEVKLLGELNKKSPLWTLATTRCEFPDDGTIRLPVIPGGEPIPFLDPYDPY